MTHYIDKDIIIAEIEKLKSVYLSTFSKGESEESCYEAISYISICNKILSLIDNIDIKCIDLENSMVCKVGWYDGPLLDYTQEQQDDLLEKIGANVGDKIRVILIKE